MRGATRRTHPLAGIFPLSRMRAFHRWGGGAQTAAMPAGDGTRRLTRVTQSASIDLLRCASRACASLRVAIASTTSRAFVAPRPCWWPARQFSYVVEDTRQRDRSDNAPDDAPVQRCEACFTAPSHAV